MIRCRRQDAVAHAERRASEQIRHAGAATSALRSDETSSLFPASIVGCGVALGLGLSWLTGARQRTRTTVPAMPPAGALASLGALLRAAQHLAPLMQARPGTAAASAPADRNAKTDAPVASPPDSADVATGAADLSVAEQASVSAFEEVGRD